MKLLDRLGMNQVERRLKKLRQSFKDTTIRQGWVRYMRQALGMTLNKLAKRSGLSIGTVAQVERSETVGTVTINTLKKMAKALECEFVYAFVPKDDLDTILKKAAIKKAAQVLSTADVHMGLEDQQVEQSLEERIHRLADELIEKGDVW